jgi:hypothetical protein
VSVTASRYDEARALAQKLLADVRKSITRNEQLLRGRDRPSRETDLRSRLQHWRARWL